MTQNDTDRRDPQTYAIIGAAMEVHRVLKHGFLEAVYQEALAFEFDERGIPYRREAPLAVRYKQKMLDCSYRADFVCYDEIIVETKATERLTGIDQAQVINYLRATGYKRALLINFGAVRLEYMRIVV